MASDCLGSHWPFMISMGSMGSMGCEDLGRSGLHRSYKFYEKSPADLNLYTWT